MIAAAMILWSGAATVCASQDAPNPTERPAEDQALLERLARTLGQVHYLRTLCRGEDDQTWRTRMSRLVEVEAPDEPLRRRLVDAFNDGWLTLQPRYTECGAPARDEAARAAQAGAMLADRLASRR